MQVNREPAGCGVSSLTLGAAKTPEGGDRLKTGCPERRDCAAAPGREPESQCNAGSGRTRGPARWQPRGMQSQKKKGK